MAVFKYASVQDLRDEGISTATLTDARARKLIESVSLQINELTDQWFVPVAKRLMLDGGGGSLCLAPIPILTIDDLQVLSSRSEDPGVARVGAVEPTWVIGLPSELPRFDDRYATSSPFRPSTLIPDYTVDDRKIRSLTPFPRGVNNVQVDGFFGWLQEVQDFETALAAPLAAGAGAGTQAQRLGSGSDFASINGGETILIKIDDGDEQEIELDDSDVTAEAVAARVNETILGAQAYVSSGELAIRSDTLGIESKVEITGGSGLALVGHTVGVTTGTSGAATACLVDDASGIRPGHVISFTTASRTEFTAFVKSVSGGLITFVDPVDDLAIELPIGTRVSDFGQVPAGIQQAAIRLINRQKSGVGTTAFTEEEFFSRLKRERTDNYEYQLAAQVEVTGDDVVNTLLNRYVKPPFMGMV